MTQDFQARASMSVEDVGPMFVPQRLGVGIYMHRAEDHEALLMMHLVGDWVDEDLAEVKVKRDPELVITLDTERAVGLIVQLRAMLLDAGVSGGQIIAMMKEAYARLDAVRAMDRAPEEPS